MTEQEFWAILLDVPEPQPIFYRAYYNSDGWVECYSMEDLAGNYIDVDQSTYAAAPRARVVNHKLVIVKSVGDIKKLVPGDVGTSCDPRDVCVVTTAKENIKWSLKTSETD